MTVSARVDKEGFLADLSSWNEQVAAEIAVAEGIELTANHWQVLTALRRFYQQTEVSPAMRAFVKLVKNEVGEDLGSSIELMTLFGASPAKTAAKIAGLPRPTNCL